MDGVCKKFNYDNVNFGVDPPAFGKRSHFDLFAECFPYGMNKDAFGFCQIWVWFCHLWGEEGFIRVLSYIGGVCHIWVQQRYLWFFQICVGFCQLWGEEGFLWVLSYMGRVCHVWGQQRYIWVLSNMGWVFSLIGSEKIH